MGKGKKKSEQHSFYKKYVAAVVLVLIILLVAGVAARYLRSYRSDAGQAIAKNFYFTTDLLGDSYMVDVNGSTGEGNTYSFPDVQSGTYYLYGGIEHNITIKVQNFSDTERITEEDIEYTAKVAVETPESNSGTDNNSGYEVSNVSLKKDEENYNGGKLTGRTQVTDELVLEIPSYQTKPYADGTAVTVRLESTTPYVKKMDLKFVLYSVDTALRYEVKDSVGSPYAELIIMTNVISSQIDGQNTSDVQPYLQWDSELSIDNTNNLTYTYNSDDNPLFNQIDGMTNRSMQISRALNPDESESIYFFKSDTSKNYSHSTQVVTKDTDGKYVITIE